MTEQFTGGEECPAGLAAFAGALAGEWDTVDEGMTVVVVARQQVVDRHPPDLTWSPLLDGRGDTVDI